ncbi:glycine c-acetyltransferase [Anaeramoeba ignava]|uniref:Glycine c-acetyltransferase n=1 Tax=Anaeramoeba ignava TaxID=1746090 RepID=A0A9Q0RF15_ANAIG|nr:glycine c-acetyltransferase [Anaeramoeba ignava]
MLQAKFFKPIKKNQIKLFASLKARRLIEKQLSDIKRAGLWKNERVLISQQSSAISVEGTQNEVLNFCANNYLGLSNDYSLMQAAKRTIDSHGLGLVGGRPVCGTQDIHKELEEKISKFHRKEDTLLYGSCFDANTGLFEGLIDPKTDEKVDLGIISDALNHASIIDGVRLAITPVIVGAAIKAFDTISESTELRDKLEENTLYFRKKMTDAGFKIMPGVHPIIPIMLYEGRLANEFADEMLKRGIYVIGFSYPVVPKGQARIRVQISAKHTKEQLNKAINAFIEVGKSKKVI